MATPPPLDDQFASALRALGLAGAPHRVLVALSGGCDSVVLLHLFREAARAFPLTLAAAHLDHAMRPESEADALWVRELCDGWDIPILHERLADPPRSEASARDARYEFLHRSAAAAGADVIATAHTADDQAETVLFRAVRGTGLRGLAGIRARTRSGVVRPLLGLWRADLERYALDAGLTWRSDPTNLDPRYARNLIRHRILPELEASFAPAARRKLVSLAAEAAAADAALDRLARSAEARLARRDGDAWMVDRNGLRDYHPAAATRMLRRLLRRLGPLPDRAGTRAALQFITDAPSGREMQLPGGLRIRTEFGEARIERDAAQPEDRTVEIGPDPPASDAPHSLRLGGARYRVEIAQGRGTAPGDGEGWTVALDAGSIAFPLQLRAWRPGDRIATQAGTKSLKKLFLEERISRSRRARLPVLADASGRVLWVAGVRRALLAPPGGDERALFLKIVDD